MNDKICELEKQIEQMKNELETLRKKVKQEIHIGFEDDPIFLLSKEEYERYKSKIPPICCWWWLRLPGYNSIFASLVSRSGFVYDACNCIHNDSGAIRPTIKMKEIRRLLYNGSTYMGAKNGRFFALGATWKVIDEEKGLAIAEVPIMFSRFDEESNDYKKSEVRKNLLDWYKERIEW